MFLKILRSPYDEFVWSCVNTSFAATLDRSPGTAVQLSVTFLTPCLLQHMHSTEGSYNLLRLSNIRLHLGIDLDGFRSSAPGVAT